MTLSLNIAVFDKYNEKENMEEMIVEWVWYILLGMGWNDGDICYIY
jgi:hypothetical protein